MTAWRRARLQKSGDYLLTLSPSTSDVSPRSLIRQRTAPKHSDSFSIDAAAHFRQLSAQPAIPICFSATAPQSSRLATRVQPNYAVNYSAVNCTAEPSLSPAVCIVTRSSSLEYTFSRCELS